MSKKCGTPLTIQYGGQSKNIIKLDHNPNVFLGGNITQNKKPKHNTPVIKRYKKALSKLMEIYGNLYDAKIYAHAIYEYIKKESPEKSIISKHDELIDKSNKDFIENTLSKTSLVSNAVEYYEKTKTKEEIEKLKQVVKTDDIFGTPEQREIKELNKKIYDKLMNEFNTNLFDAKKYKSMILRSIKDDKLTSLEKHQKAYELSTKEYVDNIDKDIKSSVEQYFENLPDKVKEKLSIVEKIEDNKDAVKVEEPPKKETKKKSKKK